jgi:dTDP-4-amino-4,6-dideoxygalactose transaminase
MSTETPAILGGSPAFPDGLRLLRPTLPPLQALTPGLESAFATGMVTKGPALAEYERRLADHLGVAHAIAVSSCTAGLMLVYDGLRPEGAPRAGGAAPDGASRPQAVMPSFTFMATAMAAVWAGLEPVFADIDPDTWCLDPAAAEAAITADTAVVVPVHVFGVPADVDAFGELSRRRRAPVVYDAAHGFGALRDGRPLGAAGLANVFSTSPTKLLITGEGGVVATDDDALAERVIVGREYGNPGTYDPLFAGLNARLPETSALLGTASLDLLEAEARRRNELAVVYRDLLGSVPGIVFQRVQTRDRSSMKDLSSRVVAAEFGLDRDALAAALAAEGVDTRAYYVPPVHRTVAFARTGPAYEGRLPATCALADEVLTLPAYGRMTEADVERVAGCIIAVRRHAEAIRDAAGRQRRPEE